MKNTTKRITYIKKAARYTYFADAFMGLFKIILATTSGSFLILIHAFYNITKAIAKHYSVRSHSDLYKMYRRTGFLIVLSSAIYIAYSFYIFRFGSSAEYHLYTALGIATITFTEIPVAIVGVQKAKKSHDLQTEAMKYISLASAVISLSLTQTALLSAVAAEQGDMSHYFAAGDALSGAVSMIIGIYMVLKKHKSFSDAGLNNSED